MYLIDSDVFIDAKNRHYGFAIVPGFWEWMSKAHLDGVVDTVDRVVQEVLAGDDELSAWMRDQPDSFGLKPGPDDQTALRQLSDWAVSAQYRQGAASIFLGSGDYFLVGQALSLSATVVTQEEPAPMAQKSIKIPDACRAVGVPWVSPFAMLKEQGARFTLQ